MTKEALKLALEALEEAHYKIEHKQDVVKREQAITAIKEALAQPEHGWTPERIAGMARLKEAQDKKLAQPEQELVAWMNQSDNNFFSKQKDTFTYSIPLYTSPPQRTWVGLTDEEIWETLGGIDCTRPMLIARATEAKLKEKNNE